jgi:hypothetical protein
MARDGSASPQAMDVDGNHAKQDEKLMPTQGCKQHKERTQTK